MRLLNKVYKLVGNPDLIATIRNLELNIDWVIEAGCHDGKDTLRLSQELNPIRIIAFEPDPVAYKMAQNLFHANSLSVDLHAFGLGKRNETLYANFLGGQQGTGSTFLADAGTLKVEVRRLDSFDLHLAYGGLLWLDVEGHAVQALQGAGEQIRSFSIAKVEVQMHDMSPSRLQDIFEVIKIMKRSGLVPIHAPIHPGYFGDVIFVNKVELNVFYRIWSVVLQNNLIVLHRLIYPILQKPRES